MEQKSQDFDILTKMQATQHCESTSFDYQDHSFLQPSESGPILVHSTGKDCSLVSADVELPCEVPTATGRVANETLRILKLSALFSFGVLVLSMCAVCDAQMSNFYPGLNTPDRRFKAFVGESSVSVFGVVNISENAKIEAVLLRFMATSTANNGSFFWRINRESDPKRQFSIDQGGSLRLVQPLDREEFDAYDLLIEAVDSGDNVGKNRLKIIVEDVNDNAPRPYTIPETCVFMENVPVEQLQQSYCEIRGDDPDTLENGPPFKIDVSPSFKYANFVRLNFNASGAEGNGSMTVTPLVMFDREAAEPGKFLEIPLILSDNKGYTMERSVFIVIGDVNDNPMSDGTANIRVNSYQGKLQQTVIGRVYVEDKDDWDLPDKTFTWGPGGSVTGFSLAPNGEITMSGNMAPGQYVLTSSVTDTNRNEHATGTVYVTVNAVEDAAFNNQGAVRILKGHPYGLLGPDEFIRADAQGTSPMERFVSKMAGYLGTGVSINVFSIKEGWAYLQTETLPVIDVRFSAFVDGSTGPLYRSPVVLTGLIAQHRAELEQAIGATIVSSTIDMCKLTSCDRGCQTVHSADYAGVVVSGNQTVIVGVNATSKDDCTCPVFVPPDSCQAGLCKNDGVCHNTYPRGFFCECRNDRLKGFRCQGTTRSFDGSGYAWFKPMPACTSLNVTLQFMTNEADGLLFYNGPMGENTTYAHADYRDYIILRLVSGLLEAEMLFNGVAPNPVRIASAGLNDGKWHSVALTQMGTTIELVLDNCAPGDGSPITTDSTCRRYMTTLDDDERLNVIDPLQVGGLAPLTGTDKYPSAVTSRKTSYNGCIRDLVVNNEQYDLGTPDLADETHTQIGCTLNEAVCSMNNVDGYCMHGECIADASSNVAKCICDPGYSGNRCDQEIQWVEFGPGSFIEYAVAVLLESKKSDIDVLLYPGAKSADGTLGFASDLGNKYVGTYIENYVPTGRFDLATSPANSSLVEVKIDTLQLAPNYSYWMQFSRNPVRTALSVDGSYYKLEQLNPAKTPYEIDIKQLLLGAESPAGNRAFQGCVGTFRWEHQNFPLQSASGATSTPSAADADMISIKQAKGVSSGCSTRATCASLGYSYCSVSFVCVDFWKGPFCTCPGGTLPILGSDGRLVSCRAAVAVSRLGITNNAIIIIMVFLGLLLLMVLLMVIYSRRQAPPFAPVRPVELNRDNIRPYDIEGGGEADNDQYDINGLRKPVMPLEGNGLGGFAPPVYPPQRTAPDDRINNQIRNLEADPDATAPYDELRIFEDEGDDVSRLSLESLESADENAPAGNIDQEDIGKWGPRFENLADIYGSKRE